MVNKTTFQSIFKTTSFKQWKALSGVQPITVCNKERLIDLIDVKHFHEDRSRHSLVQGSATCGSRAECGSLAPLQRLFVALIKVLHRNELWLYFLTLSLL